MLGAVEYANSIGAVTGSITCSENSDLSKVSQYPIEVTVGPEIVTGSTRMKAGTAQKMILNMISTAIMIKMGKVFSGYMVDVKTSNSKLIERAKRIIMKTTGSDYETAEKILAAASNDVKTAIQQDRKNRFQDICFRNLLIAAPIAPANRKKLYLLKKSNIFCIYFCSFLIMG